MSELGPLNLYNLASLINLNQHILNEVPAPVCAELGPAQSQTEISESLDGVSVSTYFFQFLLVSVSFFSEGYLAI